MQQHNLRAAILRRQCPLCFTAHTRHGYHCGVCEAKLVAVETVKATVVMAAGAVILFAVWWLL